MNLFITVPILIISFCGLAFSTYYIYEKINEDKKIPFK